MPDNLNINTSAKKVENEKTKSQRDELNQLRQLKNEASTKAKQEQAKTKKKVEEQIVRQAENAFMEPEPHTIAYLLKNGYVINETQVNMNERKAGESYLQGMKVIRYMARVCISILLV